MPRCCACAPTAACSERASAPSSAMSPSTSQRSPEASASVSIAAAIELDLPSIATLRDSLPALVEIAGLTATAVAQMAMAADAGA